MTDRKTILLSLFTLAVLFFGLNRWVSAQGPAPEATDGAQVVTNTTFTYQGRLDLNGSPVTDTCTFLFTMYGVQSGGTPIAPSYTASGVGVINGLFTAQVDLGAAAFDGSVRYLEVAVDCDGSGYTPIGERQPLTATPNALHALHAGSAAALHDRPVADVAPSAGQVLKWNGSQWAPATDESGGSGGGGGAITGVFAGTGLTGGGDSGDVTLGVDFTGSSGTADTAARSDHNHDSDYAAAGHNHDGRYYTESELQNGSASVDWSGLTNVPAGLDNGDDDTTYSAGTGLSLSGTTFSLDTNYADGRYWKLGGNAGTSAGTDFVGTTDDTALEVKVNGARALRIEPGASPNLIGGYSGNSVSGFGVEGATIGGGGASSAANSVDGGYGTVAGGQGNSAAYLATVGGGINNAASNSVATISGGTNNTASGSSSTVAGGDSNTADGFMSSVGGGYGNVVTDTASYGAIPGGRNNYVSGNYSLAAGNKARAEHAGTFVWADSTDADFSSTSDDQFLIRASGGVGIGTNDPSTPLHVAGPDPATNSDPTGHAALIETTDNDADNQVLALKTAYTGNPTNLNNFVTFFNGNDTPVGSIEGDSSGGVNYTSGGADFAEYMPRLVPHENIEPADIVGVIGTAITKKTSDSDRVMVVSTQPVVTGNSPGEGREERANYEMVAFVGQVPVKVRGAVDAGDYIVPSGRNDGTGVAVSPEEITAAQAGQLVGRALEDAKGAGVTKVKTLVGLPNEQVLRTVLARRDARISELEAHNAHLNARVDRLDRQNAELATRLDALERVAGQQNDAGSLARLPLPSWLLGGLLLGGMLVWRRKD